MTVSLLSLTNLARLGVLPSLTTTERMNVARSVEHRRLDERHECLSCGERATCAFAVSVREVPGLRWLDLCWRCADVMRQEAC